MDIAGDGSIQMNIQELATAVNYDLPVKIVILNNGFLGMVRQWQELFYGKRYSHSNIRNVPDFVKLAEAYDAVGLRATRPEEVEATLQQGLDTLKDSDNGFPCRTRGRCISYGFTRCGADRDGLEQVRHIKRYLVPFEKRALCHFDLKYKSLYRRKEGILKIPRCFSPRNGTHHIFSRVSHQKILREDSTYYGN